MRSVSVLSFAGLGLLLSGLLVGSGTTKQIANQDITLFENGNIYAVYNAPRVPTVFSLPKPAVVTSIVDYHWNNARGARPGTISLRSSSGRTYGPWPTKGAPGQGGVPNAYWTAYPQLQIPAGEYTVIDSDNASWSQNEGSGGAGFSKVVGYWVAGTPTPTKATPSRSPTTTGARMTAITEDRSNRNVLIWVDGSEPKTMMDVLNYHLEPTWKGTLAVTMPPTGTITFIAGDGSKGAGSDFDKKLTSCVWTGDPRDTSKLPYIIYEANGSLTCSTINKR